MVSRRPTKEPRPTIELLLWDPNDFAAETDRLAGMIRARNSLACRGPGVGRANVPEPRRGLGLMLLFEGGSTPPAARSRGGEVPGQAGPLANLLSDGLAAMRRVGGGGFRSARRRLLCELATSMLARGCAVKEVAYELGYSSPESFCRFFHRATGVSPRWFRKKC